MWEQRPQEGLRKYMGPQLFHSHFKSSKFDKSMLIDQFFVFYRINGENMLYFILQEGCYQTQKKALPQKFCWGQVLRLPVSSHCSHVSNVVIKVPTNYYVTLVYSQLLLELFSCVHKLAPSATLSKELPANSFLFVLLWCKV